MKTALSFNPTNTNVITYLQAEARKVLDAIIPSNAHIILIDYPNNPNIGDSLIWLGEIEYLKSRGLTPSYVCDVKNYNVETIKKIVNKNSIILMHGGGNFGTMWAVIQKFRLQVLRDFTQIPIVQFPQSIHFDNDEDINAMREAIAAQGNFTLLTRSQKCYEFAKHNLASSTYLCPDMAFFIGPIPTKLIPIFDRFILSRTDHEKSADLIIESRNDNFKQLTYENKDWLYASWQERLLHRAEMHTLWLRKFIDPNNFFLLFLWNQLSKLRLKRGVALLGRGRVVITDRLHAHILSILMNKPHVVIDNSYGKLSSFYQTWTFYYNRAKFVSDAKKLHTSANELDVFYSLQSISEHGK